MDSKEEKNEIINSNSKINIFENTNQDSNSNEEIRWSIEEEYFFLKFIS